MPRPIPEFTPEQIELLYSDLKNNEIAKLIGKSIGVVLGEKKRRGLTGRSEQIYKQDGLICRVTILHKKNPLEFIIDSEDEEFVKQFRWCGCQQVNKIYIKRCGGKKALHQLLCPSTETVDHINGNPLDNRKCNLRPATSKENRRNTGKISGTSKYLGVSWYGRKWRVQFQCKNIGYFSDEIEAAKIYDTLVKEHYGEFGRLNFPENQE